MSTRLRFLRRYNNWIDLAAVSEISGPPLGDFAGEDCPIRLHTSNGQYFVYSIFQRLGEAPVCENNAEWNAWHAKTSADIMEQYEGIVERWQAARQALENET